MLIHLVICDSTDDIAISENEFDIILSLYGSHLRYDNGG